VAGERIPPMALVKGQTRGLFSESHRGIDIPPSAPNTAGAVVVPEDAVVKDIYTDDSKTVHFRGYVPAGVLLLGDSGRYHLLAHLSPSAWDGGALPRLEQRYSAGEQIGLIATGLKPQRFWQAPHVHWEVRVSPYSSADALDPVAWLAGRDRREGVPSWVWLLVGVAIYKLSQR
jgi:murein DD-endopeptidase MepM/ murein hydrolase activator NlpD